VTDVKGAQGATGEMTVHVIVTGRVQGVGYRYATAEQAHQLELAGWVRNLADGRVEALLHGDEDAVRGLIQWMHKGPDMARVDDICITPSITAGDDTEAAPMPFEVRRQP
jgi:acylphosphatase